MSSEPAASSSALVEAVAGAARAWRDPEEAARTKAVGQTLDAPNRFTEEALAFAVNAAMHRLTPPALRAWLGQRRSSGGQAVAVWPGGGTPLSGLRAVLAVLLTGRRCLLRPPEPSPFLVPAFIEAVRQRGASLPFTCVASAEEGFAEAEAAVGTAGEASDEDETTFHERCEAAGIPPARRYWRGAAFSVAVLDGSEREGEREGLAEDALLYEGGGPASTRLVWAPAGTAPDPYLEAMAHFRAVFPAHPDTPGALQMQKAFLDARDRPHAFGEGLEFLMSRGAPEVQAAGHLRWTEYDALDEAESWLSAHAGEVHTVVARPALAERLQPSWKCPLLEPGTAHRRLLDAPGANDVLDFAASL